MTPRVPCLSTAEGLETESPNLGVFLVVWKRPGSMPRDPEHCQQVIRKDFPLCCPSARRLAEGAQSSPSTILQLRCHLDRQYNPAAHPFTLLIVTYSLILLLYPSSIAPYSLSRHIARSPKSLPHRRVPGTFLLGQPVDRCVRRIRRRDLPAIEWLLPLGCPRLAFEAEVVEAGLVAG